MLVSMLGVSTAGVVYPCLVEPRWLDVTHQRVRLPRVFLERPVRVLHLADLHASRFVSLEMIGEAVTLGLRERPDLICLTGDFISHRDDAPPVADYARVLRRLSAAAPTFAVVGNHDGGRWAAHAHGWANHLMIDRMLEQSGIELLHNRAQTVEVQGQKVTLAGVGDYWSREIEAARAFREAGSRWPMLLLAHNPDSKDACDHYTWDLMLSGHTHGGQVIVPFYGAPFRSVKDTRFLAGLKPWGDRQVFVTRGVGNLLGVRFNCRPEVSLLEVG
jgi:predicted MPP superfamily phosphohydrolase